MTLIGKLSVHYGLSMVVASIPLVDHRRRSPVGAVIVVVLVGLDDVCQGVSVYAINITLARLPDCEDRALAIRENACTRAESSCII